MAKVVPISDGKKKKGMIYQLRVSLVGSKPEIYRKFQVEDKISLYALHNVLQIVMNWTNAHLHMFDINGKKYSMPDYMEEADAAAEKFADEQDIILADLNLSENSTFKYIYDIGDNWDHTVVVEKISDKESGKKYPRCTEGKMACPPEDCGGIEEYYEMLKAFKDPKHEEHEDIVEWLGDDFDPEEFDIEDTNDFLSEVREIPDYDLYEYYEQFDDEDDDDIY
jgi:hypothetical protein